MEMYTLPVLGNVRQCHLPWQICLRPRLDRQDRASRSRRAGIKTPWLNVAWRGLPAARAWGSPACPAGEDPVGGGDFPEQPIDVLGETWIVSSVNTGNPHCVTYVDDAMALDFPRIGPAFENHKLFPARANIEFVEVVDDHTLRVRVWERGSGETLACGTGSTAALAVTARLGKCGDEADVILRGGTLHIAWDRTQDLLYMTGPAAFVFDGTVTL